MGILPGPLIRAPVLFALTIPLVVSVVWFLIFFSIGFHSNCDFYVGCVCTSRSRFKKWSTHRNMLVPKILIFPPNLKICYITIFMVENFHTHYDRCCFAKDMIRRQPMGSIRCPSNPGSRGTEDTKLIQCVDGWEPQIHKIRCLSLDNITQEVHPKARVEVVAGTVGEFTTNYLYENRRRILIIGQLSINGIVKFLGIPGFSRRSGCCFFPNC